VKDRENMNKILPYIVIAIMLGTVIMVVPYVLLGPSDYTSMSGESTLIQPSPAETEQPSAPIEPEPVPSPLQEERGYTEGGDLLSDDSSTPVPSAPTEPSAPTSTPTPVPSAVPEPSEPEASELAATKSTDLIIESLSVLSPIGLMTIPSFLIALGAFIYLKKRRS